MAPVIERRARLRSLMDWVSDVGGGGGGWRGVGGGGGRLLWGLSNLI